MLKRNLIAHAMNHDIQEAGQAVVDMYICTITMSSSSLICIQIRSINNTKNSTNCLELLALLAEKNANYGQIMYTQRLEGRCRLFVYFSKLEIYSDDLI